ncbi:MAG: NYN domain-containing protein [Hyphomicrobiaceae bacterium]
MKRDATKPALSAIFVDYDNIYLSLKRKNDDAAKRFSKDASLWIKELESGRLITPTNSIGDIGPRRIVMNRCYGNSVPRRNAHDNSTDMNSFPFVRNHFLRAGSETIDCPPLTSQMKNSADIRMVMDIRDMLTHDTYFDEFIILSGDADFTPLIHRLRAHARRTVIFSNEHTVSPYTAISDGEVREVNLLQLLLDGKIADPVLTANGEPAALPAPKTDMSTLRREIVAEIATIVRQSGQPVPLEALADRAVRQLGHDKTAGTGWGGTGGFRDLLTTYLPEGLRISDQAPFVVFEVARMLPPDAPRLEAQRPEPSRVEVPHAEIRQPEIRQPELRADQPRPDMVRPDIQRLDRTPPIAQRTPIAAPTPVQPQYAPASVQQQVPAQTQYASAAPIPAALEPVHASAPAPVTAVPAAPLAVAAPQRPLAPHAPIAATPAQLTPQLQRAPQPQQPAPQQRAQSQTAIAIQQAVARIYDACQAPPLSPPEYRALFEVIAQEIGTRGLTGAPTLDNIVGAAKSLGVDIRRDDVRFILEVVSETDPWFEQGASANLFASRFRNFVVARCRTHGLTLSAEELDLIEHWFAGSQTPPQQAALPQAAAPAPEPQRAPAPQAAASQPQTQVTTSNDRWWSMDPNPASGPLGEMAPGEEFPRIIRSRMRG